MTEEVAMRTLQGIEVYQVSGGMIGGGTGPGGIPLLQAGSGGDNHGSVPAFTEDRGGIERCTGSRTRAVACWILGNVTWDLGSGAVRDWLDTLPRGNPPVPFDPSGARPIAPVHTPGSGGGGWVDPGR